MNYIVIFKHKTDVIHNTHRHIIPSPKEIQQEKKETIVNHIYKGFKLKVTYKVYYLPVQGWTKVLQINLGGYNKPYSMFVGMAHGQYDTNVEIEEHFKDVCWWRKDQDDENLFEWIINEKITIIYNKKKQRIYINHGKNRYSLSFGWYK